MSRRHLQRGVRGFTLIEIVIAVGVLAMVGAILFTSMTLTMRGRRVAYRLQERFQSARVALSRMTRELEAAYLSRHVNLDKYPKTIFLGKSDRVDFTYMGHLRIVEGMKESDQGAVSYYLASDPDIPGTKALMRREKVPVDDRPEKGGVTEKLAENVKSIRFEYWDPIDQDWQRDWKAELSDLDPVDPTGQANPALKAQRALETLSESEDEFVLPSRVRIQLVLLDAEKKEYPFETQARVYVRDALDW